MSRSGAAEGAGWSCWRSRLRNRGRRWRSGWSRWKKRMEQQREEMEELAEERARRTLRGLGRPPRPSETGGVEAQHKRTMNSDRGGKQTKKERIIPTYVASTIPIYCSSQINSPSLSLPRSRLLARLFVPPSSLLGFAQASTKSTAKILGIPARAAAFGGRNLNCGECETAWFYALNGSFPTRQFYSMVVFPLPFSDSEH